MVAESFFRQQPRQSNRRQVLNKTELIESIAAATGESKKTVQGVLEATIDTVQTQVKKGEKVSLPGFGTFERRARSARTARNPQTGEPIDIKASKVPAFKPGASFKTIVNV
jgi:DNA-binding protein HU-beta